MKRRLNYTDRKRILREGISIVVDRSDGVTRSFSAKIDLTALPLPPDAKVYLHAYDRWEELIYDFGIAEKIQPPADTALRGLAGTENLKFRVLAIDESGERGLILAHADRIRPFPKAKRKSILPVDFDDIGQQTWKVVYEGDEGAPVLILQRKPNLETLAKTDPTFFFLVYPAVVREVLTHMVFIDGIDSVEEPSVEWHGDWLHFARLVLSGEGSPSILDSKNEDFRSDEIERWIDRVVEEFCFSRKEWSSFVKKVSEGETA
jgi:hypothetical protein